MRLGIIVFLLFFSTKLMAQTTASHEFVPGVSMNTSKAKIVDITVAMIVDFIKKDIGEIQKRLRKDYNLKINDKNINAVLEQIAKDYRDELSKLDDWADSKMRQKYHLHPASILGRQLLIPGFKRIGTDRMNDGYLSLKFKDGKILQLYASAKTTYTNKLFSGYNHNEAQALWAERTAADFLGPVKYEIRKTTTWECSSRGDTNYQYNFSNNTGEFLSYFTFNFDVLVQSTGINECRVTGNHLTDVGVTINREFAREKDFKERT